MFTGIIEELGVVEKIDSYRGIRRLKIKTEKVLQDARVGDSISVNGACLTITSIENNNLSFEVMPETLNNTDLKNLKVKDKVNLERALKLNDRLSGHLVSGHIDCLGVIRNKSNLSGNVVFDIAIANELMKYVVDKGSVAVDGISLTVAKIRGNVFSVNIIPHTLKNTTLAFKTPSDKVNIEFDLVGKHISSILKSGQK